VANTTLAVLEGDRSLLDWGVKDVAGNKNAESLRKITELVTRYEPDAVVLEDYAGAGSRRAKRIAQLIDATEQLTVVRKNQDSSLLAAGDTEVLRAKRRDHQAYHRSGDRHAIP
jgi:hypothetical protein